MEGFAQAVLFAQQVTSAHNSLTRANHVALMNHKGAMKYGPIIIFGRRENQKYLVGNTNHYHTLSDIKTYKTVVITIMWYQHSKTNKPMEQNQEFRNRHRETCSLPCQSKKKVDFSINGA